LIGREWSHVPLTAERVVALHETSIRYTIQDIGRVLSRGLRAGGSKDMNHRHNIVFTTPLHMYVCKNRTRIRNHLLLGAAAGLHASGDTRHGFVIHAACFGGSAIVVRSFISKGVDLHTEHSHYGSRLHLACFGGSKAVGDFLLEHNANVILQGGHHDSAPIGAIKLHRLTITQQLVEYGAETDGTEYHCRAFLHHASAKGSFSLARLLLKNDVDPNIVVESVGDTPFHAATRVLYALWAPKPIDLATSQRNVSVR
jgi:hypothetical protein